MKPKLLIIAVLLSLQSPAPAQERYYLPIVQVIGTTTGATPKIVSNRSLVRGSFRTQIHTWLFTKHFGWVRMNIAAPSQEVRGREKRTGHLSLKFRDGRVSITERRTKTGEYVLLARYH